MPEMHEENQSVIAKLRALLPVIVLLLVFFIADRALKWVAVNILPTEGLFIIPKTTGLILERNQGIAYSIPLPLHLLIPLVGVIIGILVYILARSIIKQNRKIFTASGLTILGAVSNLIDRINFGQVIDMLALTVWPVFNLADLFILIGGVWLCWLILRSRQTIF